MSSSPTAASGPSAHRARHTLAFHFRWQSTRFRNSLRAGAALTASLVVARVVDFDHGFWVVLGTLMVLRSGGERHHGDGTPGAAGDARRLRHRRPDRVPRQRQGHAALWFLLPVVTFLAAWAPGAIGLGSGQAAFTIFVVVLFNLAAPEGTQTAVIRLETVATGILVAVLAGFLFWPRGPQASVGPISARLVPGVGRQHQGRERGGARRAGRRRRTRPGPPRAGRRP